MKNHWFTAFLCILFAFATTGCGNSQAGNKKRRYGTTTQTGTNIPRWSTDSSSAGDTRKQRRAKPKRERREAKKAKPEKPRRERQESRGRETEEVITRGGFR